MSERTDALFTNPEQKATPAEPSKAGRRRRVDLQIFDDAGHVDQKATYYTMSVRFPKEYKELLRDVAFDDRLEGGVTEYLNNLVAADLKKRGKI